MDTWIRERFEHANRIVDELAHPGMLPDTILNIQEIFVSQWLGSLEPSFVQEWKRVENEGCTMEYPWLEVQDGLIEQIWSQNRELT
jgi:hypothetical protein